MDDRFSEYSRSSSPDRLSEYSDRDFLDLPSRARDGPAFVSTPHFPRDRIADWGDVNVGRSVQSRPSLSRTHTFETTVRFREPVEHTPPKQFGVPDSHLGRSSDTMFGSHTSAPGYENTRFSRREVRPDTFNGQSCEWQDFAVHFEQVAR